jgi:NTE family protein
VTTAFVLGGGGRWGAVEVGMLQALEEAGIRPDLILGTSIGAFNGSVIARETGPAGVKRLIDLWSEIASSDMFTSRLIDRIKNLAALRPAIHDTSELGRMLQRIHGEGAKIEDLVIPFQCVASSIEKSAEHWFTEGPLVEALLASSAIPVLLPPVEIGGEHFYDGGLVNSIPIDRAIELGATTIYALQVGRIEASLRPPDRLHEAALISFEIARRHRFSTQFQKLPKEVDLHLLPSGNPVQFDDRRQLRWRDTGSTLELIEGAHGATSHYLSQVGLS